MRFAWGQREAACTLGSKPAGEELGPGRPGRFFGESTPSAFLTGEKSSLRLVSTITGFAANGSASKTKSVRT